MIFPLKDKENMKKIASLKQTLTFRIMKIRNDELGQSTAEYALVILGAAAIALLLITWASSTGSISSLFESIISRVASKTS